ncbi:MAG: winged helix-turn-helix transcriptional regulator [Candidatus Woesearchaeota archaeon]
MHKEPQYCVYYDKETEEIQDFFPTSITADRRNTVITAWEQEIQRKILKSLSEGDLTMQELRKTIGHSNSTLHENVKKLEEQELIHTQLIYEGNKIRVLKPAFLFVTQNPKGKAQIKKFFQGIWVDSETNKKVIDFLKQNNQEYYTAEEIAAKTRLPVDDVQLALNNWESTVTRALSDVNKQQPFQKKILYKGL